MTVVVERGPWKAVWEGGRLADVYHLEADQALDCFEVGEYDFALSREDLEAARAGLNADDVRAALDQWVMECGDDYLRELPHLR